MFANSSHENFCFFRDRTITWLKDLASKYLFQFLEFQHHVFENSTLYKDCLVNFFQFWELKHNMFANCSLEYFWVFSATELIDFTRATLSDEIEDEPGNPWDESTTPVGSHFGESGDRIRSGEDPTKLWLPSSLTLRSNKLERLSMTFFQASLIFVSRVSYLPIECSRGDNRGLYYKTFYGRN